MATRIWLAALMLLWAAVAQSAPPAMLEPRTGMALIRATDLIGSGVENQPGVDLGKLVELVVLPASGKVPFAVIDLDPAGRSERLHAIPLDALASTEFLDRYAANAHRLTRDTPPAAAGATHPGIRQ